MKKILQIYILCRNRLRFAEEAILSVLESANESTEIIVSDNSDGDEVEVLVADRFPTVFYRRRSPVLNAVEHYRKVIEESSLEYLVIFHDDDRMCREYVHVMLFLMERNIDLSAIGCNGAIINEDGIFSGKHLIKGNANAIQRIDGKLIVKSYLSLGSTGIPPFPGYIYRRKHLSQNMMDSLHGGKHCDVSFLIKVNNAAPILWIRESLIEYRIHANNDSKKESIQDRLSLLRYLFSHERVDRKSKDVLDYKFKYWLSWWQKKRKEDDIRFLPRGRVERTVFIFLICTSVKLALTDADFWKILIRKAKIRLARYD